MERISTPSSSMVSSVQDNMMEYMVRLNSQQTDWILAFQSNIPLQPFNLVKWIIIVHKDYAEDIDNSIRNIIKASGPNNDKILAIQMVKLHDHFITTYLNNIYYAQQDVKDLQMFFVIVPNDRLDLQFTLTGHLKNVQFPAKCLAVDDAISLGLLRNAIDKENRMSETFGVELNPWPNRSSLDNLMIVGFDVYQPKGCDIITSGMIYTVDDSFFSITSTHQLKEELLTNFNINFKECCNTYKLVKRCLPDRIIIFRGEEDMNLLDYIKTSELPQILNTLRQLYGADGKQIPKLSYIVVAKIINENMKSEAEVENTESDIPPSSTVVDGEVTLPLRYHFTLTSLKARPVYKSTSFFVLYDMQGLTLDQMKALTYQICHLCFDWNGKVLIPFPCLLAYKLAFVIRVLSGKKAQDDAEHNISFL